MSYLNNAKQYVADLHAAAESEDWERYAAVQSQLAVESTLSALQQVQQQAQAAEKGRQEAIKQFEENDPGFGQVLTENRERLQQQRPKLAAAISYAENDPRLRDDLQELYAVANDTLKVLKAGGAPNSTRQARSEEPTTPVSLSTSAARRRLIASFEDRFGDVDIDRADTSQQNIGCRSRNHDRS